MQESFGNQLFFEVKKDTIYTKTPATIATTPNQLTIASHLGIFLRDSSILSPDLRTGRASSILDKFIFRSLTDSTAVNRDINIDIPRILIPVACKIKLNLVLDNTTTPISVKKPISNIFPGPLD